MANDSIRVIARIVARSETVKETQAVLQGLVDPTRREAGCVRYELMQNRQNAAEFTFVEEWANETALNAHFTTEHVKAAFAKVPALLAEPPDIRQYKLL